MPEALACPRCGGSLDEGGFYGPCAGCRAELRDRAAVRAVWHRLLGWLTPGWGPRKDEVAPEVFDEMARREREAKEARWRARRSRR